MEESQHNAVLQLEAGALLTKRLETAMAQLEQTATAAACLDAGAVPALTRALCRHADSSEVRLAALKTLSILCRWQPRTALLLRSSHALYCALGLLDGALAAPSMPLALGAAELLHWSAVSQAPRPRD